MANGNKVTLTQLTLSKANISVGFLEINIKKFDTHGNAWFTQNHHGESIKLDVSVKSQINFAAPCWHRS